MAVFPDPKGSHAKPRRGWKFLVVGLEAMGLSVPTGPHAVGLAEQLEAVFARHPGTDEVVLHVVVGSREVTVHADDKQFPMRARIDTPFELAVFLDGGILPYTLRRLARAGD